MTPLAHAPPAGGAPLEDLLAAGVVALVGAIALAATTLAYRRGGARPLRLIETKAAKEMGLPRWAALPTILCTASLLTAVFGFYWDVSTHIDNGRDAGPFANPSHYFILAGLVGIALAGYLSLLFAAEAEPVSGLRIRGRTIPLGGLLILMCGGIALAGFPLDDVWHRLFGQDVTLWGPTHIQMVGGASLVTLAVWVVFAETSRERREPRLGRWLLGRRQPMIAGAFLVGLSTLQGEFDFGVPQFRLLYHPILIMLAASIGLVAARVKLRRWSALQAALFFILLRGALSLIIGPGLGRITMHFPLYLVEAAVVELVAMRVSTTRPVTFGALAGAGIGTIGLAGEWLWSHIWMPIPWPAELLPEAAVLGFIAAVSGGVLGGLVGRALTPAERGPVPRWAVAGAALGALVCLAFPAPMGPAPGVRADVTLDRGGEEAVVTARLNPAAAAEDAIWFHALAWQGLEWRDGSSRLVELREVSPGVYRTLEPVPVTGSWKSLLRLHVDDKLLALPLYLPADPAIDAPEVEARDAFMREFVMDKRIVQREAITSNVGLQRIAYGVLLLIAFLWIAGFAWALTRLEPRRSTHPVEPGARPAIQGAR